MTDYQLKRQLAKIAKNLVGLDKRMSIMERVAQAKYTSITDGSMTYYDTDGNATVTIGKQPDGTYTTVDTNGPELPAPSTPILAPRTGTLTITWDGLDANGVAGWSPIFDHVEVHLSTTPAFTPTDTTEIVTFRSLKGEAATFALDANTYYVKFVAVNTSRVESAPSEEVSATTVDPAVLNGAITYFEDEPPLGLDENDEGALWFDTNNGNMLSRWDGTAWVSFTLGEDALDTSIIDSIDDAVTASINAETTAQSKARLDYSTTQPTGLTSTDRVLWMDPTNGYAAQYWDGSSWTPYFFGSEAVGFDASDIGGATELYVDQQVTLSADGKNKVTYSTGVPGTTANTAGDVWFQYNVSEQIIGQWRGTGGTSWTAVTLENSVIATLDAAKINTGFLDVANRIQTNSIAIGQVNDLQPALNAKTTTFAQSSIPTSLAIGDLWVDTDDSNKTYRAAAVGATTIGGGAWVLINDPTAKTTTFAQSAIPTSIAAGDLWVDTDDSNKIYRAASAGATTIAGGAWVLVNDLSVKTRTFAQTSIPTSTAAGDLWVDTDDSNKLYRAFAAGVSTVGASAWVLVNDITTKTTTFAQTSIPTSTAAGDLWVDTDDSNKLYRAFAAGVSTIGGSAWVLIDDPTAKTTTFAQAGVPVSQAAGDLWIDTDDSNKIYRAAIRGADAITAGEWVLFNDLTTKVKTFAQTSIPTAVTAGDLWVDTDDNNKLYRAFAAGVSTIGPTAWVLIQDAVGQVAALQTLWGHPSNTTFIDGGDVFTNSIRASSLLLTDINNYLTDPGFTDNSSRSWVLPTGSSIVPGTGTTAGYMILNAASTSTNINGGDATFWATEAGTEYQITGEWAGVGTNSGTTTFTPSIISVNESSTIVSALSASGISVGTSTTWTPFEFDATIPVNGARFRWFPIINASVVNNKVWVRNIKIRRKNAGSLIVDGTIKASQLDVDAIETRHISAGAVKAAELDVEVLKAGFTLTGRVQVGETYWTPGEGLVIPQPDGGQIRLPADGVTPATFDGHVNATSATIKNNLIMMGTSNQISGSLKLSNGITNPTIAPSTYQSWPSVYSSLLDASSFSYPANIGACPHHSDPNLFAATIIIGSSSIRIINRTTGDWSADPFNTTNFGAWGGIGMYSGHYYIYGQDGARSGAWFIYKIRGSDWTKVDEELVTSDSNYHISGRPSLTVDSGGTVHIFYSVGVEGRHRTYDSNLNFTGDLVYNNYGIPVNHVSSYVGNADMGSLYWFIGIEETKTVVAFNSSGVYEPANSFTNADSTEIRGLWYDTTDSRFKSYNKQGRLHSYAQRKQNEAITASYVWWDDIGTTRTTQESPATSFTVPARAYLNVETSIPPDSGDTNPANVDKANMVKIYVGVGAGARRVQNSGNPLGVDGSGVSIRTLTIDAIATGSATAPGANTFIGGATSPGQIISAETDGVNPLLVISGDGTINGQLIEDTGWFTVPAAGSGLPDRFLNSWTNLGSGFQVARYCRINGIVYIEGTIVPGTNGLPAFTLPAGFRPAASIMMSGQSNATALTGGRFEIEASGAIRPQAAVTWLGITCSFKASV